MFMARSSVLFPVPEGPMMLMTSPGLISAFTSLSTVRVLPSGLRKLLLRCLMLMFILFLDEEVQQQTDYPCKDKIYYCYEQQGDKGVKGAAADKVARPGEVLNGNITDYGSIL